MCVCVFGVNIPMKETKKQDTNFIFRICREKEREQRVEDKRGLEQKCMEIQKIEKSIE